MYENDASVCTVLCSPPRGVGFSVPYALVYEICKKARFKDRYDLYLQYVLLFVKKILCESASLYKRLQSLSPGIA